MKKILIIPDINNVDEFISFANENGLGFEYNDFYMPDVLDNSCKIDNIMNLYTGKRLPQMTTVHGAFYDVVPISVDEKIREVSVLRIEQSIEVAKRIGAKAVIFHTNYNPFLNSEGYIEQWITQNIEFWSEILCSHRDIDIYIENMFDTTPYIIERLSEKLAEYDNYGVCFDYAHAVLSQVEPQEWIKRLGKYIKHIHINDNDLISDLHLPWGEGKIKREEFYQYYNEYMNNATILIETCLLKNIKKSLETMKKDGFIE